MHWTQRPGGKRKLAKAMKKAYQLKKARKAHRASPSDDHRRPQIAAGVTEKKNGRALAKEDVAVLARIGAHMRLIELEREAERLRIFLGVAG